MSGSPIKSIKLQETLANSTQQQTVYAAVCGIGLGHITRTAAFFKKMPKVNARLIFGTYLDGLDYAIKRGLPVVESVPLRMSNFPDGTVDFKTTASSNPGFFFGLWLILRQIVGEIRNIQSLKPSLVFSDSRASSVIAAWFLRVRCILLVNQFLVLMPRKPSHHPIKFADQIFFLIANLIWIFVRTAVVGIWSLADEILIPDFPPPYSISLGNLVIPMRYRYKLRFIGPILERMPKELPRQIEIKRKLGLDPHKKLIYAAISGPRTEREYLVARIVQALRGLQGCEVVMSRGEPNGQGRSEKLAGITIYDWVPNQDELIKACDLLISRAGHGTIMKSIAYRKPTILIPTPDHTEQMLNARKAEALGFASVILQGQISSNRLQFLIEVMLKGSKRVSPSQKAGPDLGIDVSA